MPTADERRELIARLRKLPAAAAETAERLGDAGLDEPYRAGGWTARQVIHHLADSHMNGFIRMKLVLTEEKPTLKPYDQEAWSMLADAAQPLGTSLLILEGLHARWALLLESLPESSWQRSAIHPEIGEITLDDLLATYAGHGEKHLNQIAGLGVANAR